MESNFSRVAQVTFMNFNELPNYHINIECLIEGSTIIVQETLTLEYKINNIVEVSVFIKMIGVFEKIGDTQQTLEEFGYINGAAILYPYIREQFSNLSLKSGIGNFIIPPVNFVKMYSEKKAQLN